MINTTKIELQLYRLLFICSSLQTHPMYVKYEKQLSKFSISSRLQHAYIKNPSFIMCLSVCVNEIFWHNTASSGMTMSLIYIAVQKKERSENISRIKSAYA